MVIVVHTPSSVVLIRIDSQQQRKHGCSTAAHMRLAIQDTASALSISSSLEKMPKVAEQIQRNGKRRSIEDRRFIWLFFLFWQPAEWQQGWRRHRWRWESGQRSNSALSSSGRKYPNNRLIRKRRNLTKCRNIYAHIPWTPLIKKKLPGQAYLISISCL